MFSKSLFEMRLILFSVGSFAIWIGWVDAVSNFTMNARDYDCHNGEIICLGNAHVYSGLNPLSFPGTLSLTFADYFENMENDGVSAGIAYYSQPIRLLDPSSRRAASFSTSFQFYELPFTSEVDNSSYIYQGDGMTFVISANNSVLGAEAQSFGIFDNGRQTSFKSVVVEFDSFRNDEAPMYDISDNHVSLDFHNITAIVARNASDVDVVFASSTPIFVWIEYDTETQNLEVRIGTSEIKPVNPFLSHRVNLFDVVDEYMWVGFSAGNGLRYSAYYIGNWTFQSYGIPAKVFVPPGDAKPRHKSTTVVKYSVGASACLLFVILIVALWFLRRRRLSSVGAILPTSNMNGNGSPKASSNKLHTDEFGTEDGHRFSYEELRVATRKFADDTKLGEGGSGCVYRGELPNSNVSVAVKRVARESELGKKAFTAEVSIISQLRHRNLLRLLGWCVGKGDYYIVYDLMTNGSLDKLLFRSQNETLLLLSWSQRLKVIQGVAAAVEYLHHGWNQQVIHRDIKASNIMLDEQWNPKLGDFGLARLEDHQRTPSTTVIAGTFGYIAPDVLSSRRFTEKTDVFAFGALCLEVACGRKCFAPHLEAETVLVDWVWECLSQGQLLSVVDKRLPEYDEDQMTVLLLLGLICSHPDPAARPPMRIAVQVLRGDAPMPHVPISKPRPVYEDFSLDRNLHSQTAHDIS